MLSKCLNSSCRATFQYLGRGRLFRVDFNEARRRGTSTGKKAVTPIRSKTHPIEHFWLCERCAASMTVQLSDAGEVCIVPKVRRPEAASIKPTERKRGASAS